VTIYGITDINTADDADRGGNHRNVIDSETMYLLDEYFNPWDLSQAVEKNTQRWVDFVWHDGESTGWITDHKPVMDVSDLMWDQYNQFSERVIDLNESQLLYRRNGDYTFYVDEDGYGHFGDLLSDHDYKILYSTDTEYADWGPFELSDAWTGTDIDSMFEAYDYTDFEDWLGAYHYIDVYADLT